MKMRTSGLADVIASSALRHAITQTAHSGLQTALRSASQCDHAVNTAQAEETACVLALASASKRME